MHITPTIIGAAIGAVLLIPLVRYDIMYRKLPKYLYWVTAILIGLTCWFVYHNPLLEITAFVLAILVGRFWAYYVKKLGRNPLGSVDVNVIVLLFMLVQGYAVAVAVLAVMFYVLGAGVLRIKSTPFFLAVWLGLVVVLAGLLL